MLNISQVIWKRWVLVPILVAFAAACTEDQPTVTGISLAKGGGGGKAPTVDDTEPPGAPQDTTLDVQIFGSGFDNGSVAEFTLDGVPTPKVRTNSTRFVKQSEVVANITVTLDADTALYDVEVMTTKGKKGVGADLFKVVEKEPADPQIAYVDGDDLIVMNASGAHKTVIHTPPVDFLFTTAWSPNGGTVAFSAATPAAWYSIHRIDVTVVDETPVGLNLQTLIDGTDAGYASWAPDGTSIAFHDQCPGTTNDRACIFSMPSDGSGSPTLMYEDPGGASTRGPSWNPAGTEIAFVYRGSEYELRILTVATGAVRTLVPSSELAGGLRGLPPAWSPDGSVIAFSAPGEPSRGKGKPCYEPMLVVAVATGELTETGVCGMAPSWGPSGSRIAYESSGIHVLDLETGESTTLSHRGRTPDWRW